MTSVSDRLDCGPFGLDTTRVHLGDVRRAESYAAAPVRRRESDRFKGHSVLYQFRYKIASRQVGFAAALTGNAGQGSRTHLDCAITAIATRGVLDGKIQFSNLQAGARFAKALEILIRHASSDCEPTPIASYQRPKRWPSTVFLPCAALISAPLFLLSLRTISSKASNLGEASGGLVDTHHTFSAGVSEHGQTMEKRAKRHSVAPGRPLVIVPGRLESSGSSHQARSMVR